MKKISKRTLLIAIFLPALVVVVLCFFMTGITNISAGHAQEDKTRLEEALRRSAVACYAAEGIYPPTVEYMVEHYGIQIDENRFAVSYNITAQNLMPDITVLEK